MPMVRDNDEERESRIDELLAALRHEKPLLPRRSDRVSIRAVYATLGSDQNDVERRSHANTSSRPGRRRSRDRGGRHRVGGG
jgi:hypothetical protein